MGRWKLSVFFTGYGSCGLISLLALIELFRLSVCPNLTILNDTSGVIPSPFYPRHYPKNQRCSWQITTSKGKHIVLDVEYMDIENCGGCSCDYLEIKSGLSLDGNAAGRKCSYMSERITYYWFREGFKVLFVSNGNNRWYRGFRATFTQVNPTGKL